MAGALRPAALLAALFLLAGCATTPEIPYDRSTAKVQTIGLPTPAIPNHPHVVLASTVGQSLGLLGGLVDIAMQDQRDAKFEALIQGQHFVARDQFCTDLSKALEAKGFNVVTYKADRKKEDFLDTYPPAPQPVDAYLDVVVKDYGYLAAGIGDSTPYRPYLIARFKLVRASDSSVLMEDSILLNPIYPSKKQITLSPDPAYEFSTFDDLTAVPVKATAGVESALARSSDTIGGLLQ